MNEWRTSISQKSLVNLRGRTGSGRRAGQGTVLRATAPSTPCPLTVVQSTIRGAVRRITTALPEHWPRGHGQGRHTGRPECHHGQWGRTLRGRDDGSSPTRRNDAPWGLCQSWTSGDQQGMMRRRSWCSSSCVYCSARPGWWTLLASSSLETKLYLEKHNRRARMKREMMMRWSDVMEKKVMSIITIPPSAGHTWILNKAGECHRETREPQHRYS